MNLYKSAMLLRYYKYDLKDVRKKIKLHRVLFFALANVLSFLYTKTKDPFFLLLSYYYLAEEFNSFLNLEIYSKEYYELKNLYGDIIKRYNDDINRTFNFTDPVEISEAYIFAYKKGFLSKNGTFFYLADSKQLIENYTILGASIFTGNACCRHSARLLSDMLNDYGFNSVFIPTGLNSASKIFEFSKSKISSFDSLISLTSSVLNENDINEEKFIDYAYELFNEDFNIVKKWDYDINKVPLNHTITGVSYNGLAYYIDPTNEDYYRMDKESGRLINDSDTIENTIKSRSFDVLKYRKKIKKILSLPSIDFDFVNTTRIKTNLLCNKNLDIFEDFYKDNHEVYDEITEKLKKINM